MTAADRPPVTDNARAERDALAAKVAAVEALLRNPDGVPHGNTYQVTAARLRAALSAAPTDTTKETTVTTPGLIEMPGHPHRGDCEGTLCSDCGCCWHKRECDADCCHDRDCGCSL